MSRALQKVGDWHSYPLFCSFTEGGDTVIDLYSDTTTRPSEGMRRAMYEAEVGDEQRGLDPTVIRLQEEVAALLGKEAALFLPSTTMANQIAIKLHTDPGDEVILDALSHPVYAEAGGAGLISGALFNTIQSERGIFGPAQVRAAVRPSLPMFAPSRALWIENTHNMGGGSVWPLESLLAVTSEARSLGLTLHLDGARIMNASVASGHRPDTLAAPFDTVSICLTKGLGAPVGGLIAGSSALMQRARRYKQALGGAMRQAGVLAAAGLYALRNNVERLADDHRRARRLALGIAQSDRIETDVDGVETNMVFFRPAYRTDLEHMRQRLAEAGVLVSLVRGGAYFRAVTHLDVSDADIERAIQVISEVIGQG